MIRTHRIELPLDFSLVWGRIVQYTLRSTALLWLAGCCVSTAIAQIEDVPLSKLVADLSDNKSEVRRDAAYEIVRRGEYTDDVVLGFAKTVSDRDIQVRFQSLLGLARAREKAAPAIDALIGVLGDRDDQVRYRAADALGKIGPAAIDPLLASFEESSRDSFRIAAAQAFGVMKSDAKPALDILRKTLENASGDLARNCAEALVAIEPAAVKHLIGMSRHEEGDVRRIAVRALANTGAVSDEIESVFRKAAGDSDSGVREATALAVSASNLSVREKSTLIETALLDDVNAVRAAAIAALRRAKLPGGKLARRIADRIEDAGDQNANSILKALSAIGSDAIGTLPQVIRSAGRPSIDKKLVSVTIASFGESVVPDLLDRLDADSSLSNIVADALAEIGFPAVDSLVGCLDSESEEVRLSAVVALSRITPYSETQMSAFELAASDGSAKVRRATMNALASSTSMTNTLTEKLLAATKESNGKVRAAAVLAVSSLDLPSDELKELIESGGADPNKHVRVATAGLIGLLDNEANKYQSELLRLANDKKIAVRVAALETIGMLDAKKVGDDVVSELASRLADSNNQVRVIATKCIVDLKLSDPVVLESLEGNLVDHEELLSVTLEALSLLGKKASSSATTVANLLEHDKASLRSIAVKTLSAIQPDEEILVGHLIDVLNDQEWEVRRVAAESLGNMGKKAVDAVPKLFLLLKSEEDSDHASGALREIDTASVEALPLLIEGLGSEDRRTAFYSVFLIEKLGPSAVDALPKLEQLLVGEDGQETSGFMTRFYKQAIASIKGEKREDDDD